MEQEILTVNVTQLNNYIKRVLDANSYLGNIWVKGELSNFKLHSSGHIYASLKDEGALIRLVMFRSSAQSLTFRPDNGMKVVVRGRVSVYERDGIYQIYAEEIVPDGVGALYAAYEKLKAKLKDEGLFEDAYKKPLPVFPTRIGVVTAKTGAALQDILNITRRRYPLAEIILAPVCVQGVSAAPEIANAISLLNKHHLCDVMIVGRGGGSIEDLWAFNEELVARAIFSSHIPVVSAVGHETDFTIADFVADLRAPTPSAAAELVCPSVSELRVGVQAVRRQLNSVLLQYLEQKKKHLDKLADAYGFQQFAGRLENDAQYVDSVTKRLEHAADLFIEKKQSRLETVAAKLDTLSPLKTLFRGYAIATKADGTLLSSSKDFQKDKEFLLRLKDGKAHCKAI